MLQDSSENDVPAAAFGAAAAVRDGNTISKNCSPQVDTLGLACAALGNLPRSKFYSPARHGRVAWQLAQKRKKAAAMLFVRVSKALKHKHACCMSQVQLQALKHMCLQLSNEEPAAEEPLSAVRSKVRKMLNRFGTESWTQNNVFEEAERKLGLDAKKYRKLLRQETLWWAHPDTDTEEEMAKVEHAEREKELAANNAEPTTAPAAAAAKEAAAPLEEAAAAAKEAAAAAAAEAANEAATAQAAAAAKEAAAPLEEAAAAAEEAAAAAAAEGIAAPTAEEAAAAAAAAEGIAAPTAEVTAFSIENIKIALQKNNLSTDGSKIDLCARLEKMPKASKDSIMNFTDAQLKDVLQKNKLSTYGSKIWLYSRVVGHGLMDSLLQDTEGAKALAPATATAKAKGDSNSKTSAEEMPPPGAQKPPARKENNDAQTETTVSKTKMPCFDTFMNTDAKGVNTFDQVAFAAKCQELDYQELDRQLT